MKGPGQPMGFEPEDGPCENCNRAPTACVCGCECDTSGLLTSPHVWFFAICCTLFWVLFFSLFG